MGNSNKKPEEYEVVRSFKPQQWINLEKKSNYQIWQNSSHNIRSEVYPIKSQIKTADFDHYEMRYNNSQDIVKVHGLRLDNDSSLCSKSADAHVYVERIPYRLGDVQPLSIPEALSVLSSSYRGFNTLSTFYGPVEPYEDLICFNQHGKTKVWISSNLAQNRLTKQRQQKPINNIANLNTAYVNKLLDMVQNKTQGGALPAKLKNKFRQVNPKTYFQALNLIQQYATEQNILIPLTINTIRGAQNNLSNSNSMNTIQKLVNNNESSYNLVRQTSPSFNGRQGFNSNHQSRFIQNTTQQPLRSTILNPSQSFYSYAQSNNLNKIKSDNSITFKINSPLPPAIQKQNNIKSNIIINNFTVPPSPPVVLRTNYPPPTQNNFPLVPSSPQQRLLVQQTPHKINFESPSKVVALETLKQFTLNNNKSNINIIQSSNRQTSSPTKLSQHKQIQRQQNISSIPTPQKPVFIQSNNQSASQRNQNYQVVIPQNVITPINVQKSPQGYLVNEGFQRPIMTNQPVLVQGFPTNQNIFGQAILQQFNSPPMQQPFRIAPQNFNQNGIQFQQIGQPLLQQPIVKVQNPPQRVIVQPVQSVQLVQAVQPKQQQQIIKSPTIWAVQQNKQIIINKIQQKQPQKKVDISHTNEIKHQYQRQQQSEQYNRDGQEVQQQLNRLSKQKLYGYLQQIKPNNQQHHQQYHEQYHEQYHQQHDQQHNQKQHYQQHHQQQHNYQQHYEQQHHQQQRNQVNKQQHQYKSNYFPFVGQIQSLGAQDMKRVDTIQLKNQHIQLANDHVNVHQQQKPIQSYGQPKQRQQQFQATFAVKTSIDGLANPYPSYQYQYQSQNQNHTYQTQNERIPEDAQYQDIQHYIRNKYKTYIGTDDVSSTSNYRPSSQVSPYSGYQSYTDPKVDKVDVTQMASYVQSKYDQYKQYPSQPVQFSFRPAQPKQNNMAQSYQYMRVQHNNYNFKSEQQPQQLHIQRKSILTNQQNQQKIQQKQDDILDVKHMERSLDKKYSSIRSNQQLKDLDSIKNQQQQQNEFDVKKLQQNLLKYEENRIGNQNSAVQPRFETSQVSKIHSIDERLGGNRRSSMNRDFNTRQPEIGKYSYENQSPIYQFATKSRGSKVSKQLTDIDEKFNKYIKQGAASSNSSKAILKQKQDNYNSRDYQYGNSSSRMATGHFGYNEYQKNQQKKYTQKYGYGHDDKDRNYKKSDYDKKNSFDIKSSKGLSYEDLRRYMWS